MFGVVVAEHFPVATDLQKPVAQTEIGFPRSSIYIVIGDFPPRKQTTCATCHDRFNINFSHSVLNGISDGHWLPGRQADIRA